MILDATGPNLTSPPTQFRPVEWGGGQGYGHSCVYFWRWSRSHPGIKRKLDSTNEPETWQPLLQTGLKPPLLSRDNNAEQIVLCQLGNNETRKSRQVSCAIHATTNAARWEGTCRKSIVSRSHESWHGTQGHYMVMISRIIADVFVSVGVSGNTLCWPALHHVRLFFVARLLHPPPYRLWKKTRKPISWPRQTTFARAGLEGGATCSPFGNHKSLTRSTASRWRDRASWWILEKDWGCNTLECTTSSTIKMEESSLVLD